MINWSNQTPLEQAEDILADSRPQRPAQANVVALEAIPEHRERAVPIDFGRGAAAPRRRQPLVGALGLALLLVVGPLILLAYWCGAVLFLLAETLLRLLSRKLRGITR